MDTIAMWIGYVIMTGAGGAVAVLSLWWLFEWKRERLREERRSKLAGSPNSVSYSVNHKKMASPSTNPPPPPPSKKPRVN